MQNVWDEFEWKFVKVVDKIVPLTNFVNKKAQTASLLKSNGKLI